MASAEPSVRRLTEVRHLSDLLDQVVTKTELNTTIEDVDRPNDAEPWTGEDPLDRVEWDDLPRVVGKQLDVLVDLRHELVALSNQLEANISAIDRASRLSDRWASAMNSYTLLLVVLTFAMLAMGAIQIVISLAS